MFMPLDIKYNMLRFGLSSCIALVGIGFYLGFCKQELNGCGSNPCQNGGTCSDGTNEHTCACVAGYTGINCEIDVYECLSSPCTVEGSWCEDQVNSYQCGCEEDYISPNSVQSRLYACESKGKNAEIVSPNGTYHVDIQEDGNLVLYYEKGKDFWKWHANTPGYSSNIRLLLDVDGDLKLIKGDALVWNTGTKGQQIAYAEVTDEGVFRLVRTNGSVAWERTKGKDKEDEHNDNDVE